LTTATRPPLSASTRALLALELFVAFWAFAGGIGMMGGGLDLPSEWLEGTPFSDYFIPGLILFIVVGGACLLRRSPSGREIVSPDQRLW